MLEVIVPMNELMARQIAVRFVFQQTRRDVRRWQPSAIISNLNYTEAAAVITMELYFDFRFVGIKSLDPRVMKLDRIVYFLKEFVWKHSVAQP